MKTLFRILYFSITVGLCSILCFQCASTRSTADCADVLYQKKITKAKIIAWKHSLKSIKMTSSIKKESPLPPWENLYSSIEPMIIPSKEPMVKSQWLKVKKEIWDRSSAVDSIPREKYNEDLRPEEEGLKSLNEAKGINDIEEGKERRDPRHEQALKSGKNLLKSAGISLLLAAGLALSAGLYAPGFITTLLLMGFLSGLLVSFFSAIDSLRNYNRTDNHEGDWMPILSLISVPLIFIVGIVSTLAFAFRDF